MIAAASTLLVSGKDRIPISKEAESALVDFLKAHWFLKEHDRLGHRFASAFKGVKVIRVNLAPELIGYQ